MAPAQALDGDDEDGNGKNHNVVIKSEDVCANNCEDKVFHAAESVDGSSDDKVVGVELVKDEDGQSTEYSSSFGDSCSQSDDEMKSDLSGIEVDSPFVASSNGDPAASNGSPRLFRKKKVTAQWRKTVSPLMWRCQWLELRMKDLVSQISKYDKELALIKHEKNLQSEVTKSDGSLSGAAPLSCRSHENNSMKRRKRKRNEDIFDTSLYIKKHQIFSYYYESQNRGTETEGLVVDDDCNGPVGEDVQGGLDTDWFLSSKESDSVLKQLSLKEILSRIDAIQSRVVMLRDCLDQASIKQERMASSVDHSQVKVAPKSQNRTPSCKKDVNGLLQKKNDVNSLLQNKDGDKPPVAVPLTSSESSVDRIIEDANLRHGVHKSKGDTTHPDINDITAELLFGADNPLTKGPIGDFSKENSDDVLIDNEAAKEGYQQFEKVKHPAETPAELVMHVPKIPISKGENAGPLVLKQEQVSEMPMIGALQEAPVPKQEQVPEMPMVDALQEAPLQEAPVPKQEPVPEPPMIGTLQEAVVKSACAGRKRGRKAKKRGGSAAISSARTVKSAQTPPAKKQKTENSAPSKLKGEKIVLVAANSRRSQRVRKPKVY